MTTKTIKRKNSDLMLPEHKKNLSVTLVMLFLALQSIFELNIFFDNEQINLFGFSVSTIFRYMGVIVIFVYFFFHRKFKKTDLLFAGYFVLVAAYLVLHHLNSGSFISTVPGNLNYSLVSELLYISRLVLPMVMMIVSINLKVPDYQFKRIVVTNVIVVSGSIVVTNLLGCSLGSYTNETIKGSIFAWFSRDIGYMHLASKSFFYMANSISALLIMLTPVLFFFLLKKGGVLLSVLTVVQGLAMFMIGTKVAMFGFLIVLFLNILLYLFFSLIKKEMRFNWKKLTFLGVILVCFVLLYPYSPSITRTNLDSSLQSTYNESTQKELDEGLKQLPINELEVDIGELVKEYTDDHIDLSSNKSYKELIRFIRSSYKSYNINETFILDSYNYKNDPYFWYQIVKEPVENRMDNRYIEKAMLHRIKELNDNPGDDLFGITYTRMNNMFNLEKDFESHFYTLGIAGLVLLLMPYIAFTLLSGLKMLIRFKRLFTLKNVEIVLSVGITLFAAFYSGNVMDNLCISLILSFIIGQLVYKCFASNKPEHTSADLAESENEIKRCKVTIMALHLKFGGVEKFIVDTAEFLSKKYDVEIVVTYRYPDKRILKVPDGVTVKYLLGDNLIPENAKPVAKLHSSGVGGFIGDAWRAARILVLRYTRMVRYIEWCDSDIIISTRDFHNRIMSDFAHDGALKIVTEHNFYNKKYSDRVIDTSYEADYFVVSTEAQREYYCRRMKFADIKVVVIPFAVKNMPDTLSQLDSDKLITVGRLCVEKGYGDLIDIMKEVHAKLPSLKLTIVGSGSEHDSLETKITKSGLADTVSLVGEKTPDEISAMLGDASLYLMTSTMESFGIVLIEAMSHGVPCIIFDSAAGALGLIDDGVNGFKISGRDKAAFASKITELCAYRPALKVLGEGARAKSQEFTSDKVSGMWDELLSEK